MDSFHYKKQIFPVLTVLPVLHQQVKFLCIFLTRLLMKCQMGVNYWFSVYLWLHLLLQTFEISFESVFIYFAVLILVLFLPTIINIVQQNTMWHQYLISPKYIFLLYTIHYSIYLNQNIFNCIYLMSLL